MEIKKLNFKILDCFKVCFEQVKSYSNCKNKLRIVGDSRKKLKFQFENGENRVLKGLVYVKFVALNNSMDNVMLNFDHDESKEIEFKCGRGNGVVECYSPFEVGRFEVVLCVKIDSELFEHRVKTIKGTPNGPLVETYIENYSHRKTIKNEHSIYLTESAKNARKEGTEIKKRKSDSGSDSEEERAKKNQKLNNNPSSLFPENSKTSIDLSVDWKLEAMKWQRAYEQLVVLFSNNLKNNIALPPIAQMMQK